MDSPEQSHSVRNCDLESHVILSDAVVYNRDIPSQYILGGLNVPNMRQNLLSDMKKRGLRCRCIRCREVGLDRSNAVARAELTERYRLVA